MLEGAMAALGLQATPMFAGRIWAKFGNSCFRWMRLLWRKRSLFFRLIFFLKCYILMVFGLDVHQYCILIKAKIHSVWK